TVTHDATLPITTSTTVTWTYADASGNTSTQTQEVVIEDTTAPVADVVELVDVVGGCLVETLATPTATDNCSGTVTVAHDATLPIIESTTVTWIYTDGSGNTSTQTQKVVIEDTTAPVADVAELIDIVSGCSVESLTAPTATDNCSENVIITHNVTLPITESTRVTWTYTDMSGNSSTQTQIVQIEGPASPELAAIDDQVVGQGDELSFPVTVVENTCGTLVYRLDETSISKGMQIDASTGVFSWTPTQTNGGTHEVTVTVSDGNLEDSETVLVIVNGVLGAEEIDTNISLYPNPVMDELSIDGDYIEAILYSSYGKQVGSWKANKRLNLSGVDTGLYILVVTTDRGRFSHKIMKQ
ncbi:HYR-like domain-containing protein, partial [Reichenbachiella agariperforans]|uniref:HYR-like domain-containing protein n=1 Tax=Reichenbachiella agariperforans TaxID=156994 RepID=UPI001C09549D